MTVTFPPPTKPWSTNQDRNLNPYQRAERIKAWKETTWAQLLGKHIQPPLLVELTIPFTTSRRRDPHNYCGTVLKAVIDGIVLAGLAPDDTGEWVAHREPTLVKGDTVILRLEAT